VRLRRALATTLAVLALIAPALAVAAPAPAFSGRTLAGATISLSQFRGSTVVLEWVNEGCPYVQKHYGAGAMQATQREARAQGVIWIQVVSSAPGQQGHFATPAAAKAWLAKQQSAPSHMILDPGGVIGRAYRATTTPEMFVIDPSGALVYRGAIDNRPTSRTADLAGARNYVRAALADLEAGRPVQTAFARSYGCGIKYSS
jgi:peroxiredoxin